jgi:hypothetical protein
MSPRRSWTPAEGDSSDLDVLLGWVIYDPLDDLPAVCTNVYNWYNRPSSACGKDLKKDWVCPWCEPF